MKKVLIIDHYDSFTYNLVQCFQEIGRGTGRDLSVQVKKCDEIDVPMAQDLAPDYLVFSPGPGSVYEAKDIGNSEDILKHFIGRIPILGVCLGHQLIGKLYGGKITTVEPCHGKSWPIKIIKNSALFKDLPKTFEVMRYHSQIVADDTKGLTTTAITSDDSAQIMALEDVERRLYGVQFHPESIGTPYGLKILENFLNV